MSANLPPCEVDDETVDLEALLRASLTLRVPRGFHEQADASLVCPHRDLSVCSTCAGSSPAIVEVMGNHYWVPDAVERAEISGR